MKKSDSAVVSVEVKAPTVVVLKTAAKTLGLTGVSKLLKADLESEVMSSRDGRKAVYTVLDDKFAEQVVTAVLGQGSFFLPRPAVIPEPVAIAPVVGKVLTSLGQLGGGHQRAESKVFKQNSKNKAAYVGKIQAIKRYIRANELRQVRWYENDDGFSLAVQKAAKAA